MRNMFLLHEIGFSSLSGHDSGVFLVFVLGQQLSVTDEPPYSLLVPAKLSEETP